MTVSERVTDWLLDDDEEWEDSAYSRVLLALTGALIARMGFSMWTSLEPGSIGGFVAIFGSFAVGSQLFIFAATGLDLETYGRWISILIMASLTIVFLAALSRRLIPAQGTDAMAFSAHSAELVLQGANPYTESMRPAIEGSARRFSTPRIDGTNVEKVSYPAGAFLMFVPQKALVGGELRYTTLTVVLATAGYLTYALEAEFALAGVTSMFALRNMWRTALGGVFDIFWVLPVLITMQLFWAERYRLAAVPFGVAAAMKQLPWAIGPFLAIWLWQEADDIRQFGRWAGGCLAIGLGTFALINLPFILAAPRAWLTGVLTPIAGGAPLVHQGVGLTMLTVLGLVPLSTTWHAFAVFGMTTTLLAAYWFYFDELQWAAWLLPLCIWLVHYRSLTSYFVSFAPIAVFAVALAHDRVRWAATPTSAPAEEDAPEEEVQPC